MSAAVLIVSADASLADDLLRLAAAADVPAQVAVDVPGSRARWRDATLVVDVVDDGVGLPAGFSVEQSGGLGLSIVHTLVTSELGGTIELRSDRGTRVHLTVPVRRLGTTTL